MATPNQIEAAQILQALRFQQLEPERIVPGAPIEFCVTDETLSFLQAKTFVVKADGSIAMKKS